MEVDALSTRPIILRGCGDAQRLVHLKKHLKFSRRFKSAAVVTRTPEFVKCIYRIRPPMLIDAVPDDNTSHSEIYFPRKKLRFLSTNSLCCQGLHRTTCAAEYNKYNLLVITGPIGGNHKKRTAWEVGRPIAWRPEDTRNWEDLHRCWYHASSYIKRWRKLANRLP